jgi:hypothetical protein
MSTPAVTPDPNNPPVKVEFTPEQQEHINGLFNSRFAKIQSKHEQEMQAMSQKLEELKAAIPQKNDPPTNGGNNGGGNADEENKRQMKALLDAEKAEKASLRNLLDAEKQEKAKIVEENKKILKDNAINDAASSLPNGVEFHELKTVKKLVEDDIVFDQEANQWVVKENGATKMNSSLLPMTLTEYFAQFAAARPYLVKGTVKGGSGSAESGRNGSHQGGVGVVRTKADVKTTKDKVDFIAKFGYDQWAKLPTK